MFLKKISDLPLEFKNNEVIFYYNILKGKKVSLIAKRIFDIIVSSLMLLILLPVILIIAIFIKLDSPGKVVFKQKRVTRYGKMFYIYKFRTMVENAESLGSQVTVDNDSRITGVGKFLRKYRLDELLQLLNIIKGEMTFVGTRPEVEKYVKAYSKEMYATLLLPAGVTSLASIKYKDEEKLLQNADDADKTYIEAVLPEKMKYNLDYTLNFNFFYDIKIMIMTVLAVIGR